MGMTKKDYLRKKGLLPKKDFGIMHFAYFNRDKREIGTFEQKIWQVEEFNYSQTDKSGKFIDRKGMRFKFKDRFPYEISFYEGENSGSEVGMASGFGDLTVWAYYGFLNAQDMEDKYFNLTQKYPQAWDEPRPDIIMPRS